MQGERCRKEGWLCKHESLSSGLQHPHKKVDVAMHACKTSTGGGGGDKDGKVEFAGHHPSSRLGTRTCLKK